MSTMLAKNVRKHCLHACDFFHVWAPKVIKPLTAPKRYRKKKFKNWKFLYVAKDKMKSKLSIFEKFDLCKFVSNFQQKSS